MYFRILGPITDVETIAVGAAIREIGRLRKRYGKGRWRKRKGFARVELTDGTVHQAVVHWYDATGIGRREYKLKCYLD